MCLWRRAALLESIARAAVSSINILSVSDGVCWTSVCEYKETLHILKPLLGTGFFFFFSFKGRKRLDGTDTAGWGNAVLMLLLDLRFTGRLLNGQHGHIRHEWWTPSLLERTWSMAFLMSTYWLLGQYGEIFYPELLGLWFWVKFPESLIKDQTASCDRSAKLFNMLFSVSNNSKIACTLGSRPSRS